MGGRLWNGFRVELVMMGFCKHDSFLIYGAGVGLSPVLHGPFIGLLYQPWMINGGDCGAVGGMNVGQGNRSTQREPALSALTSGLLV
jgi:hypothetical protein